MDTGLSAPTIAAIILYVLGPVLLAYAYRCERRRRVEEKLPATFQRDLHLNALIGDATFTAIMGAACLIVGAFLFYIGA